MVINILIAIIITGFMSAFCYINYKKCKDDLEKSLYILLFFVSIVPAVIYYLDKYNVPTHLGWNVNVNTQNWLAFLANYSSSIISAIISAVILVIVTILQIKKNNEDNIKRDRESLRLQNMPILKYLIDTKNKSEGTLDELIITNTESGNVYNLNISIKNIGLNNIKSIKVDFKSSIIGNSVYRILGDQSIEVLEKGEVIELKRFFSLKLSNEPYDIDIIIYYEDVLSNWYRQVLNIHYIATDISKDGYISTARYEVNREEIIEEEETESKVIL